MVASLAFVIDAETGHISYIDHQFGLHIRTYHPYRKMGLIFPRDRGSQYASGDSNSPPPDG